ncbi:MAG: thiamine phosphate synthase [Pirellulales bacterium]
MRYQFTPGAERALAAAARWTSGNDCDALEPAELLLGLLDEVECRAARMLAAKGIHAPLVQAQWPELKVRAGQPANRIRTFSDQLASSLEAAVMRLADHPRPLVLATEHLLLALVSHKHEVSSWLARHGFAAEEMACEIDRLYGLAAGPLPLGASEQAGQRTSQGGGEPAAHDESAPPDPAASIYERPRVARILDAAANRAREALRVIEDYARFALDDAGLTSQIKQLRHAISQTLSALVPRQALAARDTEADVGTGLTAASESRRADLESVLTANFKRLEEALRSLEEYGKLLDPALAEQCKQWRYRTYTLHRAVVLAGRTHARPDLPRLCVLVDGGLSEAAFAERIEALLAAGVRLLQLRDKTLDDRALLARARTARSLTRAAAALLIINDRADLAALVNADGVHVGQHDLAVSEARAMVSVSGSALVGVSTHSLEQARQAEADGADYIGVGPTFASNTKRFEPGELQGVELLRAVAAEIHLPAFAIGGIDRGNLPQVLAAGFSRVAVSGAVAQAAHPASAAAELLEMLGTRARNNE